ALAGDADKPELRPAEPAMTVEPPAGSRGLPRRADAVAASRGAVIRDDDTAENPRVVDEPRAEPPRPSRAAAPSRRAAEPWQPVSDGPRRTAPASSRRMATDPGDAPRPGRAAADPARSRVAPSRSAAEPTRSVAGSPGSVPGPSRSVPGPRRSAVRPSRAADPES